MEIADLVKKIMAEAYEARITALEADLRRARSQIGELERALGRGPLVERSGPAFHLLRSS